MTGQYPRQSLQLRLKVHSLFLQNSFDFRKSTTFCYCYYYQFSILFVVLKTTQSNDTLPRGCLEITGHDANCKVIGVESAGCLVIRYDTLEGEHTEQTNTQTNKHRLNNKNFKWCMHTIDGCMLQREMLVSNNEVLIRN